MFTPKSSDLCHLHIEAAVGHKYSQGFRKHQKPRSLQKAWSPKPPTPWLYKTRSEASWRGQRASGGLWSQRETGGNNAKIKGKARIHTRGAGGPPASPPLPPPHTVCALSQPQLKIKHNQQPTEESTISKGFPHSHPLGGPGPRQPHQGGLPASWEPEPQTNPSAVSHRGYPHLLSPLAC